MARIRVPLTSFDYGEVSPNLLSRTDSQVYNRAAQTLRNFFIRSEGGLEKRAGTRIWAEAESAVTYSGSAIGMQLRLEPFVFSDDEQYIIAFSNLRCDIYRLLTDGTVSHIQALTADSGAAALPWTQAKLGEITFAQAGDVMFICHTTFPIRKLVRTGLTTFQVDTFAFEQSSDDNLTFQPYHSFQDVGVTLSSNATTGSGATLTSSAAYFESGHVGTTLRIGTTDALITGFTNNTTVTATIKGTLRRQLAIDALETVEGSSTVLVTHALHGLTATASVVIDRAAAVGGIAASNINGTRTVSAVLDENTYEITAAASATSTAVGGGSPRIATGAATTEWAEQSYSSLRGYPAAVTFHEGRLWFAGTQAQPNHLWASKSNRFFNFDVGDGNDDDSIDISGAIGTFDQIRHLVSNRDLQIFASESEFFIPAFTTTPITPATARVRRQTPFGSNFVRPEPLDGATLHVQKAGNAVREYIFSDSEGAYVSTELSVLSSHLITTPWQQAVSKGAMNKPESFAFYVGSDGDLTVFYSMRADKRQGWMRWNTTGSFHSVCAVGTRLFTATVRDNGSGTNKFYIEEFQADQPMDYCKTYSGSSGVFSVSSNFSNGATVKVVNGTDYLGEFTVASGNVDVSAVDATASSASIGLAFTPTMKTLPIDGNVQNGPMTGKPRRITSVILDLVDTLSVSVDGTDLVIRNVNDDFSVARTAISGKKEFFVLGFDRDPTVTVSQSAPMSLSLNGLVMEMTI
tara:strand:+ start:5777 stop:8014 length:2238 start_codon:yes stop_codon:yes gene_type:complete